MADGIRTVGLTLRLDKAHHASPDNVVVIRAGEADGTTLQMIIKSAGGDETFTTGTKCYLCVPMPEDESIELECTLTENVAVVTLPAAVGAVAETKPNCYLKLVNTSNETVATTESFTIRVVAGAGEVDYDIADFEPYVGLKLATDAANSAASSAYTAAGFANNAADAANAAAALITNPTLKATSNGSGTITITVVGASS